MTCFILHSNRLYRPVNCLRQEAEEEPGHGVADTDQTDQDTALSAREAEFPGVILPLVS